MITKDRLIVALDVDSASKALKIVDQLAGSVRFFKVGLELFSSCGPKVVETLRDKRCEIFLDLKFHDIPTTVAKAALAVTRLGSYMFNVHTLGGYDMMKKTAEMVAAEASTLGIERPKILGVTILTSMDEKALKRVGVNASMTAQVLKLAKLAFAAGLDGVVASPAEAKEIRKATGKSFLIVTPGVRPAWAGAKDQKRIATPRSAIASGADFIVVGRPITEARDPAYAARKIVKEMEG